MSMNDQTANLPPGNLPPANLPPANLPPANLPPANLPHTPEMPRAYNPVEVESKWYRFWMEKAYFKAAIDPSRNPFTIIMPPPNITGDLHMGHALTDTLEDIMIRWHRMKGDAALWLPGLDHASIAAQVVVERQLAAEGLSRHQLGREQFLERMQVWAKSCRGRITAQHQSLGASCDWSRERFTMDEGPNMAVRTAFVRLYNKGLIYRGTRIINWCPRCTTALSDLEVDHADIAGQLYFIRYYLPPANLPPANLPPANLPPANLPPEPEYITVATTRPETLLGDTAVAVNPGDVRFKDVIGKKVIIPFVNRIVPVVADEVIDASFGTGAVKVTPSHDPVDFEIAGRQNLPAINILNPDGSLNENAGPYKGLDRFAARKQIIEDLKRAGQLVKIENYTHNIGHCQRCQTIVEPVSSRQWFVKMTPLAGPALEAVKSGRILVRPERFIKVYTEWLENIRDWCISRQLWWGHRIPVWYCPDCGEITAATATPITCPKCGSRNIYQDNDVLDTWFSSGLWPHSTLGWPEDTADYRYFYPTTVMETAMTVSFSGLPG
jgi:valyl-tRNA synthetase